MKPLVSVLVTCFNHERFIHGALESVISQKTDFPFEILVGNDCSKDDTAYFIEKIRSNNMTVLHHERNIGGHENFSLLWSMAKGKYIAWLEGDDYWINERKLQLQVNAMESAPSANVCFGLTQNIEVNGINRELFPPMPFPRVTTFSDLALGNFIHTPSVLYRSKVVTNYPEWIKRLPLGDWPLHLAHARTGSIVFVPELLAAYRLNPEGAWSSKDEIYRIKQTILVSKEVSNHLELSLDQRQALLQGQIYWSQRLEAIELEAQSPRASNFSFLRKFWR